MERRKAITFATAASITFVLGAAGMTANAAILGGRNTGGVGQLSPITVPASTATSSKPSVPDATTSTGVTTPEPSADGAPPSQAPSADPSIAPAPAEGGTSPSTATRHETPPPTGAVSGSHDSTEVETEPTESPEVETPEVEAPEADD